MARLTVPALTHFVAPPYEINASRDNRPAAASRRRLHESNDPSALSPTFTKNVVAIAVSSLRIEVALDRFDGPEFQVNYFGKSQGTLAPSSAKWTPDGMKIPAADGTDIEGPAVQSACDAVIRAEGIGSEPPRQLWDGDHSPVASDGPGIDRPRRKKSPLQSRRLRPDKTSFIPTEST